MLVVVLAAAALAGCGGRSQSAADGGAQAPTWVKAYSYAGGPLTLKATSQAPDGSQYALVTQPECSGSKCNEALAVARIDPAGNVMWVRRPVGTVSGDLSTTPADVPRQRLVAPLPDGGAWIVGGRNEQTAAGADVETARLERLTADGAIAQTLPLPENLRLVAMVPAAGGLVAAGELSFDGRRQPWVLHVAADGRVRTARTVAPTDDARTDVEVSGVAFDATGHWIVGGRVSPPGQWTTARVRDFVIAFDPEDNVLFRRADTPADIRGPAGIVFDAYYADKAVRLGRGQGAATEDWIVTSPRGLLMRHDARTGERREAVWAPDDVGGPCAYVDLRVVAGGALAPDRIEVLGEEFIGPRVCLDQWTREAGSGRLVWSGRTWLAAPQAGADWRLLRPRWDGSGRIWAISSRRGVFDGAILQRFPAGAPVTNELSVSLPGAFVQAIGVSGSPGLTVMPDGGLLMSNGQTGSALLRLRPDGVTRWSLALRGVDEFNSQVGAALQALPDGGVVAVAGRTWLRYASDGRLVSARRVDDGSLSDDTLPALMSVDRDRDGRDDALLRATREADAVVLRRFDASGEPVPGDDQRFTLPPDVYVESIRAFRVGDRRVLTILAPARVQPTDGVIEQSVFVIWVDAAGLVRDTWRVDLGPKYLGCRDEAPTPVIALPRADGGLSVLSAACLGVRLARLAITELAPDGNRERETLYVAVAESPFELDTNIQLMPALVGADRRPDGGLVLQLQWHSGVFVEGLPRYPTPQDPDFSDLAVAALAPDGTVRWIRTYGGARTDWYSDAPVGRIAQQDNGALSIGRSHSFAAPGALLGVRTDADGRVDAACAAARTEGLPRLNALGAPRQPVVTNVRLGAGSVTRTPAATSAPIAGFTDTSVTWQVAQACSGVSQAPALFVEVIGPGQVDSQPVGISCRAGLGTDCTQSYSAGTAVTLTATADAGARLVGWEGDCASAGSGTAASVRMDAGRRCVARFAASTTPPPPPPPPPPPSGSACRADQALAGAWQDATGGAMPPAVPNLGYGLGATLRGGLPLVAVSTFDGTANRHRPWVAQWTGTGWSRLGSDADPTLPGTADAPQIVAAGSEVWMAWTYTAFGQNDGLPPRRLAVWRHDGQTWSALPIPVAQDSGTLLQWWLLRPADGSPVIAWLDPSQQRIQSLRWDGSAWQPQPVLDSGLAGGRWALAMDAGGLRVAAVQARTATNGTVQLESWTRPLAPAGAAWSARTAGTLPWPGLNGQYFPSATALLLQGDRLDVALQVADSSGRTPSSGSFVTGRQTDSTATWSPRGDTSVLRREPDVGVRPVGLQLLAGCAGTPWLAWRDDLTYPDARLWAAQSVDSAPPAWSPLGGAVMADASVGSAMQLLSAPDSAPWAVVIRATRSGSNSSVLRPELRLQRFVPAGP